jgi:hypothetical protein
MQRGDTCGGSQELRQLYEEKNSAVRAAISRFCARLSEREVEAYNHRCLFVFPTGILPLKDQLAEFGGVIDDSLRSHFPSKPLFGPSLEPHLVVGLEIAHTIKELTEFNQRHNQSGGHWLTAKEWVAVLRFRKEMRHLHEPVNAVSGVLLQELDGSYIACVWRRLSANESARPHWFKPDSSIDIQQWLRPWCHDRVPQKW